MIMEKIIRFTIEEDFGDRSRDRDSRYGNYNFPPFLYEIRNKHQRTVLIDTAGVYTTFLDTNLTLTAILKTIVIRYSFHHRPFPHPSILGYILYFNILYTIPRRNILRSIYRLKSFSLTEIG